MTSVTSAVPPPSGWSSEELRHRVVDLARTPSILVACDYDGTLAPIVADPTRAAPRREAVVALRGLAALRDTHVAVVSGRALRDLAVLSRLPEEVHLVGSHGSEFDVGFVDDLPDDQRQRLGVVAAELSHVTAVTDGAFLELKPASVAFHYRNVEPGAAAAAVRRIVDGPGATPGVFTHHGKQVVELAVTEMSKGAALDSLRQQLCVGAVLFLGDDQTDEAGFLTLHGPDVGVKVGPGPTAAAFRIDGPDEVARLLAALFEIRRSWVQGESAPPIERHSLLSDQRNTALVTPDARVTWFCHPQPDSPALFAELLGGPAAGYFSVSPAIPVMPVGQRYLGDTMVLETRWSHVKVIDYLARPPTDTVDGHSSLVRVLSGQGVVVVELAPRLDFGRLPTRMHPTPGGLDIVGAPNQLVVVSPGLTWEIFEEGVHQRARAVVELVPDQPVVIELRCGPQGPDLPPEPVRRAMTADYWTSWVDALDVPDVAADAVRRSALLLAALRHEPTGALLAAATTSLPETVGGVRNWDYRFCWIRDAAMTCEALVELGSHREALDFLAWLADRERDEGAPELLRPLYSVSGHAPGAEGSIEVLSGYAGSRPVRIGNAAALQVQTDVFGPVVELIARLVRGGHQPSEAIFALLSGMVDAVAARWEQPDHGIWEVRRAPRHHVHSKVTSWIAVDRAIAVHEALGRAVPDRWRALRAAIGEETLARGWKPEVGAFTAAYDGVDLDAAALQVGLSGLLAPDDPRVVATMQAVELGLRRGPTVFRYVGDDGLPGSEGGLHLCTGWLIESYIAVGRLDDALDLFRALVDLAGPTGLLSEEYDPATERALGNVPQAYSHLAVIRAAIRLGGALDRGHRLV